MVRPGARRQHADAKRCPGRRAGRKSRRVLLRFLPTIAPPWPRPAALTTLAWAATLLSSTLAPAADWPGWLGPTRDGHSAPGGKPLTSLPADLHRVWHLKIGEGLAAPVVAGDRVYYLDARAGKEVVHAIDRRTAAEAWQAALDDLFRDAQSAPGPRCTPLVDGDRVYAQSCLGDLRCLSAADGAVRWRVNFLHDYHAGVPLESGAAKGAQRHGYTATPWVEGDKLIALVGDTNGAGVVCFDKLTGKVAWRSQNDQAGNAAPIVTRLPGSDTPQMVAFMADALVGLRLDDGANLWRVPMTTTYGRHVTTPIVAGDLVVVASKEIPLTAVAPTPDPTTEKWSTTTRWRAKNMVVNFSSPVTVGGHIYGLGPDKNLFCVEAKTGAVKWSKEGFALQPAEQSHLALVVVGDTLLALTETGELVLVAADPAGYRELGRTQACGVNWCNPAYADGRLYLRDHKELACLELVP